MSAPARWDIVVPVKGLAAAKSRLVGVDPVLRGRLALAFATDAVTAALAVSAVRRVRVVTDDPVAAAHLSRLGAHIVPESRGPGLNAAIEAGLDAVDGEDAGAESCESRGMGPDHDTGEVNGAVSRAARVAVMTGDLPAVQPAEIAAALAAAAGHPRAIVADAEGTGTVLLAADGTAVTHGTGASAGVRIRPQFGPGSCARHEAAGHVPIPGALPGLRRDVDTWEDLAEACRRGLGAATRSLLGPLRAAG